MPDHEGQTDTPSTVELGAKRKPHPNSLANLRPAWRPGVSGNPTGLTKDGQAPKAAKLRNALISQLEASGGMEALAKRWISLAKRGNGPALTAILDRLDPIEKDQDQGKTILQGLKLEITAGGASLTMGQATVQPQQAQELTAASASESFAQDGAPESRAGGPDGLDVQPPSQESPSTS